MTAPLRAAPALRRRTALSLAAALPFLPGAACAADETAWRRHRITTRVTLQQAAGPAQLWLPLAQTAAGYQANLGLGWQGSGHARILHDRRYGADLLAVDWSDNTPTKAIEVVQTVATRDRTAADPRVPATEAERQFWRQPTESLPTDGIVRDTALRITAGIGAPRERLRAIYDWVVAETVRDPHTPGCGTGSISAMLRSGRLGGKCADINSLMTGLARAAGFPARDVYGIRVAASRFAPSLGASGTITKAQHCRSEVYLDEAGWLPLDPADVRKVMLEQKLALDSPPVLALRDRLFGSWEMNWVGYNSATDLVLPGTGADRVPNFPFLMYPCAFTRTGQPDCLDARGFSYEITAREISV